jgi:2-keto-4-pentenoate hydratase/2-oxohepta-3-ene-1,7-dioic acid hydratase in catechol pathway
MIVAPTVVEDAGDLLLRTVVNGEVRQETNTSDLLFGVKALISFLSQGSTLQKGTVIMTGTPGGVALGMKDPKWLLDGDIVEVQIEHLGSCKNRVVFANSHHL